MRRRAAIVKKCRTTPNEVVSKTLNRDGDTVPFLLLIGGDKEAKVRSVVSIPFAFPSGINSITQISLCKCSESTITDSQFFSFFRSSRSAATVFKCISRRCHVYVSPNRNRNIRAHCALRWLTHFLRSLSPCSSLSFQSEWRNAKKEFERGYGLCAFMCISLALALCHTTSTRGASATLCAPQRETAERKERTEEERSLFIIYFLHT